MKKYYTMASMKGNMEARQKLEKFNETQNEILINEQKNNPINK